LAVPGFIGGLVVPVAVIMVAIVPEPLIGAVAFMEDAPTGIVEPVFIVVVDMVEGIDCPPFELPPMANAWVVRASAAITATVVNVFIW
jgi:hypothetical protein